MTHRHACLVFAVLFVAAGSVRAQNSAPPPGAVDGHVVDALSEPISHARVYAMPLNGLPEAGMRLETLTDELGHFHLAPVPAGTATVHAYKDEDGYPDTAFAFFVTSPQSVPTLSVSSGATTGGVVVRLGPKGGWLTGSVLDAQTNAIVRDASFKVSRSDDPNIWISTAPVQPNGEFKLLLPSLIGMRLEVSAPHYRTWRFGGDRRRGPTGVMRLEPDGKLVLDIKLDQE